MPEDPTTLPAVSAEATNLRDAYIAVGFAIAELRAMPLLRYSADEEDFRVLGATRALEEARHLLRVATTADGGAPITIAVEPHALKTARAIARPIVWEWIADLHKTRAQVAALIVQRDEPVPDDLPEPTWLENAAGTPVWRFAWVVGFALIVLSLFIAFVFTLVFES